MRFVLGSLHLGGIFLLGGLVGRRTPGVSCLIVRVLQFVDHGSFLLIVLITVINAIAEEMFFRGVLYTPLGRHRPVPLSTILYPGVIMSGRNLMLTGAAIVFETVCALER